MEQLVTIILAVFASVMASTGFWTFLQKKSDKKDLTKDLLMGLAHDRLMYLGMLYIDKGYVTEDEYENYMDWLYKPYKELGYNGVVKKIAESVDKLEIRRSRVPSSKSTAERRDLEHA